MLGHTRGAFANLAGVAPIPASPGQTVRHRLDRCGDRELSRGAEAGLRYDAGDAEEGFGIRTAIALAYESEHLPLTIEGSARAVLAHEESAVRESGLAFTIAWNPSLPTLMRHLHPLELL